MSDNGQEAPEEVIDEDGDVDKAVKRSIIKAREEVFETVLKVEREAEVRPDVRLTPALKTKIYGETVKQFLVRLEPLLQNDKIPGAEDYYTNVNIHTMHLVPPNHGDYDFSLVRREDLTERELRQQIGLPNQVELPKVIPITFAGLQDVIETPTVLHHEWRVCVSRSGARPNWEYVYPSVSKPVPKRVYFQAVRYANMFLEDAGIGVDVDTKGSHIIRNLDMSGEEPRAEYGMAEYDSSPEL